MNPRQRLKELEQILEDRANLGYTNFRTTMCVQIIDLGEGTVQFFESCLVKKEGEFWYVIPEHHSSGFYHEEDCMVRLYQRTYDVDAARGPL